jgi:hypothetical protein
MRGAVNFPGCFCIRDQGHEVPPSGSMTILLYQPPSGAPAGAEEADTHPNAADDTPPFSPFSPSSPCTRIF